MKSVLVVEDNPDNRAIYCVILRHHGYEVHEAVNGLQGIEQARAHQPDLIVMDISMPVMDGYGAIARIRDDEQLRKTMVIALTAHAFPEDEARIRSSGFDDYVTKPITPASFIERVRGYIGAA